MYTQPNNGNFATNTLVSFSDIKNVIRIAFDKIIQYWYVIILAGFVGSGAGIWYAASRPAIYNSSVTFALEESGGNFGGALSLAAEFGISLGNNSASLFTGDNILQILKSRRIIEAVLLSKDTMKTGEDISLADWYIRVHKPGLTKPGEHIFNTGKSVNQSTYYQDSILFRLYSDIVTNELSILKPDKRAGIFLLSFQSPDEYLAKSFSERVLEYATLFYTELRTKRSKETIDILERRLAELKSGMYTAFSSQAYLKDANVNSAFSSATVPLQRQQLNVSVYGAAYTELYKNLEIARYQFLQEKPLVQVIDRAKVPMKKTKIGRLFGGIIGSLSFCLFSVLSILSFAKRRR